MNPSTIITLVTQMLPLITGLISEIQKVQGLSEADKEALKKVVSDAKVKVAAITWEE